MSINHNKPLANLPGMRSLSDQLDEMMGWKGQYKDDSRVRGAIHGTWHTIAGVATGNEREFQRSDEQFSKMTRPPSPPHSQGE